MTSLTDRMRRPRRPLRPRDWDPRRGWMPAVLLVAMIALLTATNLLLSGRYPVPGVMALIVAVGAVVSVVLHVRRPVLDVDSPFLPPHGIPADRTFALDRASDAYATDEVESFLRSRSEPTAADIRAADFRRVGFMGLGYDATEVDRFMKAWAQRLDDLSQH